MFFLIDCCVFDVVVVVSYLTNRIDKILIDGDNKREMIIWFDHDIRVFCWFMAEKG